MFRFSVFHKILLIVVVMSIVSFGVPWYIGSRISKQYPLPVIETKINCSENLGKQIDPDNLNIIYTVPAGCAITVVPMIWTVPPPYWELLLQDYAQRHQSIPPTILLPKEWYDVIIPSERQSRGNN